jgi:hypothetical protein
MANLEDLIECGPIGRAVVGELDGDRPPLGGSPLQE